MRDAELRRGGGVRPYTTNSVGRGATAEQSSRSLPLDFRTAEGGCRILLVLCALLVCRLRRRRAHCRWGSAAIEPRSHLPTIPTIRALLSASNGIQSADLCKQQGLARERLFVIETVASESGGTIVKFWYQDDHDKCFILIKDITHI